MTQHEYRQNRTRTKINSKIEETAEDSATQESTTQLSSLNNWFGNDEMCFYFYLLLLYS